MTNSDPSASRLARRILAAAQVSAEADGERAGLPGLLRYALAARERSPTLRGRLTLEISEAAPDLGEIAEIWAETPVPNTPVLARLLDARCASSDRPLFRRLADCVRLLGASASADHVGEHRRVAAALAAALDEASPRLDPIDRARLEETVLGWGLLVAGIEDVASEFAFEAAEGLSAPRVGSIVRVAIEREREAREHELRREADKKPADRRDENGADSATCDPALSPPEGHIIVCRMREELGAKRVADVIAGHRHVIDCPVALAPTPDLAEVRRRLVFEFPYAAEVADRILEDLAGRGEVGFAATLMVGAPGGGKSRFAGRLAELLGAGTWRTDASSADGAVFGGTARRWNSAEPAHPFLAISRAQRANPVIIIDELDKSPTRSDYGRLWDALLAMLEPETSRCYPDPALQASVDLSHVSYVAIANSADPLPAPLRDRLRILSFPLPRQEDLDALLRPVFEAFARERSLDPRWLAPLSASERAAVSAHWRGGSVRKLARLIEAMLRERDRHAVRQ